MLDIVSFFQRPSLASEGDVVASAHTRTNSRVSAIPPPVVPEESKNKKKAAPEADKGPFAGSLPIHVQGNRQIFGRIYHSYLPLVSMDNMEVALLRDLTHERSKALIVHTSLLLKTTLDELPIRADALVSNFEVSPSDNVDIAAFDHVGLHVLLP